MTNDSKTNDGNKTDAPWTEPSNHPRSKKPQSSYMVEDCVEAPSGSPSSSGAASDDAGGANDAWPSWAAGQVPYGVPI